MPEDISQEHIDCATEAGASPELLAVVRNDTVVGRNSARGALRRACERAENDPDELQEIMPLGGDYFEALWEGDLATVFYHADLNNKRLLFSTFGDWYLAERLVSDDDRQREYAERLVRESKDRINGQQQA